jgi:uncharacterized protein DUF6571
MRRVGSPAGRGVTTAMGESRNANPDQLDELADMLCTLSYEGVYGDLANIFDRARALDVSDDVTGLTSLLTFLSDIAPQLRDRATLLRDGTPAPDWGMGPPPSQEAVEEYQEELEASPDELFEVVGQDNIEDFLVLARQDELSEEEMEEMRSLLGAYSDDPNFAAALVDEMGMEQFLALTRRIDGSDTEAAHDLRGELAHVLTASFWVPGNLRPGTPEYEEWITTGPGRAYAARLEAFQYSGEENLADAAQLVRGLINADDLSMTQLSALNEFLRNNNHPESGDFNRSLMDAIGPEGLVELSERLPELANSGDEQLRDHYAELQTNIANSLGNATNVDQSSIPQAQWYIDFMSEFYEVGRGEHTISFSDESDPHGIENVRGYQMLLNLMEEGHGYSTGFLTDVAADIRDAESDGTHFWALGPTDENEIEHGEGSERFARDPMNCVLRIMGQHPDAATTYLSDQDNLDYLIEREYLMAFGHDHHDPRYAYGGFGDALEAATTGHRSGSDQPYNRTPEGDQLMREVVERFTEDQGALIADDGPFADIRPQLGQMAAAYMGEFQHSVSGNDLLYDGNPPALFNDPDLDVDYFLSQVGRDPDAYATIIGAQQAYTTAAVDVAMNYVTVEEPPRANRINDAVAPGALIAGIMSSARADAIRDGIVASDEEFNSRLGLAQEVAGLVVEETTGRIPVFGGAVGWGANHLTESLIGQFERDSSQQAYEEGDNQWQAGRNATIDSAEHAIEVAAGEQWPEDSIIGFQNGADNMISTKYNEGVHMHWEDEE